MPECLVITALAHEFAEEAARLGAGDIPLVPATTTDDALSAYSGQEILFGNPDMIAALLPEMPAVRWVQSTWAGVTPLLAGDRRDYVLTGIKDVFGPQMAEYVIGYLLAHELKIAARARAQRRREWLRTPSGNLEGKRLGIMGTGSIGQAIAARARGFGMDVTGLSRSGKPRPHFDAVAKIDEIDAFLERCDHLVAVLPDTPGTTSLLNASTLANMPQDACFVNVGRSNVVDDDALVQALRSGQLAGAVLDVFDEEPLPANSALWDAPNLAITAHIAALSHPRLIVPIFVDNYARYVAGEPLRYVVDFDLGY